MMRNQWHMALCDLFPFHVFYLYLNSFVLYQLDFCYLMYANLVVYFAFVLDLLLYDKG